MSSSPVIKILLDTSNSLFSGTDDEIGIRFTKITCPDVNILTFNYKLNPDGTNVNSGTTNTYTFRDVRLKDESYVKKFTIEKKFGFVGHVFNGKLTPIPIGFSYSDDWKLKRVRIYYNNKLVVDTNPSNAENKSIWLDKSNYWFTYPDPNSEVVGPGGICGGITTKIIQQSSKPITLFSPIGIL